MSIANFSVKNPVLVNLIMVIVFLSGIYTAVVMPKEEMPAMEMGAFYITVTYPGVSSGEIEKLITKKIEDEIADIDDIDYINSTSAEGRATIFLRMLPEADIDEAWNDLNTEMDKVRDLPEDAGDPVLVRINMREVNEICTISMGGDFSGNSMREIAEDFRDELLELEHVSKVEMSGTRERQIWIENNLHKLNEYGLTLDDVISSISLRNINVPGGTVKFGRAEFIIRSLGEFKDTEEMADLILRMDENGRVIRLRDVAVVNDTLEEQQLIGKLDGKSCVNMEVYKRAEGNIITVMDNVREKAGEFRQQIPGLEIQVRNDGSIEVSNSLNTLLQNCILGLVLVFITLFIFIGWRNALFAAWGIPFSFLLTFILMQRFDITMNNLSLFGLILVLGMIVDDAIIVVENVHRYMERGLSPQEAAILGTREIMWPVIAAVATTVAAFLPLLLMKGMMGKFLSIFPIVVSLALLASLFECLMILPSHVAEFSKPVKDASQKKHRLYDWLVKKYRRAIIYALGHRKLVIGGVVMALILSVAAVVFQFVRFEFFPKNTSKTIVLNLQTPVGTNLDKTNQVVGKVEEYIRAIPEKEDIEAIITTVGQLKEHMRWQVETCNAEIKIDLREADEMTYTHAQIKNSIRSFLEDLPGLASYAIKEGEHGGPPTGNDIELRIKGDNLYRLESIGNYISQELKGIPGVTDIEVSLQPGKKELQIIPRHDKLGLYGITLSQIAGLVNTASYGATVSKFQGQQLDEFDIIVRVRQDQIETVDDLQNLMIRTAAGKSIALRELAEFKITNGYSVIEHWNKKRVLTLTGNTTVYQDGNRTLIRTPDEVADMLQGNRFTGQKGILSDFNERFPGYQIEYGGSTEEKEKTYGSLYVALAIAVLLIFTVLGTQFKSYVQPLIIMTTIPFAIVGVIFGLLITRLPFSLNTMIAVVALVGIVVNDSLVLVDFVNRERERGIDRWNSLVNAGSIRLRPIILTTVTTIAGFLPIILSTSSASSDWKPMAVSIAFGLGFATLLTLFVIPVIYSLVDSLFGRLGLTRFKEHISYDNAMATMVRPK